MKKGVRIKIKMPVLAARVTLLIGSYDQITKWIPNDERRPYFNDDEAGSYTAMCSYSFKGGCKYPFDVVIHARRFELSNIVHEIIHAVNYIQRDMGIVADFNNDELTAYMADYLFHRVELRYKKYLR